MLLLKKHLVELVRRGLKRQTIRLWTRPLVRPGQISYTPGLGKMKITAVDQLPNLQALTEADAQADGFPNLRALLAEIHRIYGPTPPANRHLYRIRFSWPIDPAGKTLVLPAPKPAPPPTQSKIKNRKSKISSPTPRPSRTHMTPTQRQSLRTFILARKPTH